MAAEGVSACEMVRERNVKTLNKEEIEAMRKVCRVSLSGPLLGVACSYKAVARGTGRHSSAHPTGNHKRRAR